MANRRIFYACQAVGIASDGTTDYEEVRGLQSVGINTTFNLQQVFEIGMISIYENIEGVADVEVTLEKVLDGFPLLYHLGTQGASSSTLVGRSNKKAILALFLRLSLLRSSLSSLFLFAIKPSRLARLPLRQCAHLAKHK